MSQSRIFGKRGFCRKRAFGERRGRASVRGFAIVSALFLIVALAALGVFMVNFSNIGHVDSAQDLQGSRAYWAAKSGVQWAGAFVVNNGACPPGQPAFGDGFAVTVTCAVNTYTEGTDTRNIYWLTATATAGGAVGGVGYVERQIQVFIQ